MMKILVSCAGILLLVLMCTVIQEMQPATTQLGGHHLDLSCATRSAIDFLSGSQVNTKKGKRAAKVLVSLHHGHHTNIAVGTCSKQLQTAM